MNQSKAIFDAVYNTYGEEKTRLIIRRYFEDMSLWPDNFIFFGTLCFPHIFTLKTPSYFYDVFSLLVSKSKYRGFAIPRGFSKTTTLDEIYFIFNALTRRRIYQIIVGQSLGKGIEVVDSIRIEFETNKFLKYFYGDMVGSNYNLTWSTQSLSLPNTTKIKAFGLGQSIRGTRFLHYRPDLINCDDLEEDKYIKNHEYRRANKDWLLRQVLPTITDDGEINVLGTILHDDSLVNNIVERKDEFKSWNTIKLKAIMPGNVPLWPERISLETAEKMKHDVNYPRFCGTLTFSREYQNEPLSDEDRIIRPEWLKEFSLQKKINEYKAKTGKGFEDLLKELEIYGGIDPAISKKQTADFFAFVTIGLDRNGILGEKGLRYVLGYFRGRLTIDEQIKAIFAQYLIFKHTLIKVEVVAYQEALKQLIIKEGRERGINPPVKEFRPDTDKIRRLTKSSASIENGLVYFRNDDPLWLAFRDEITTFPSGEHDDMTDAYMIADDCIKEQNVIRTWADKPEGF